MKTMLDVALYEFRIQIRSLVFWLTTIVLFFFWYSEVFSSHQNQILYSTATEPIIISRAGGITVDFTAEARAALQLANFSVYASWLFADRIGLMSALFIGLLAAFVFERDQTYDLLDVIHARRIKSWQYVIGKYIGIILTWGLPLVVITAIEVGSVYQMCYRASLPFAFQDFITPVFTWLGLSLLYGTVEIMFLSLLLKSGIATLLIHFFYWVYCVFHLTMFQTANSLQFLTYWFFRLDTGLSPRALGLVTNRLPDLVVNRSLYIVSTIVLLSLTTVVYQMLRERGMWALTHGKGKKTILWHFGSRDTRINSKE